MIEREGRRSVEAVAWHETDPARVYGSWNDVLVREIRLKESGPFRRYIHKASGTSVSVAKSI